MSSDCNQELNDDENNLQRGNQSGMYDIRMSEFCRSFMNYNREPIKFDNYLSISNVMSRPNSASSPIDQSTEISFIVSTALTTSSSSSDLDKNNSNESYLLPNINTSSISSNENPFTANIIVPKLNLPMSGTYTGINLYDSGIQQSCENSSNYTSSPSFTANQSSLFRNPHNKHLASNFLNDCVPKSSLYQSTPNKSLIKNDKLLVETFANNSSIENNLPVLNAVSTGRAQKTSNSSSRVNFHSILDLAKSDEQVNKFPVKESFKKPILQEKITNENVNTNNGPNSLTSLTLNEHLKHLTASLSNKENIQFDYLSKVD